MNCNDQINSFSLNCYFIKSHKIYYISIHYIPYSGHFSGGKIFVSSELLASSWKYFRGCGILNHTLVLCGTISWVKFRGLPLNHENLTPRKIPAIR